MSVSCSPAFQNRCRIPLSAPLERMPLVCLLYIVCGVVVVTRALTLVQSQSLQSNFAINVLLVPVGDCPPAVFARYASAFEEFTVMPMENLTAPGDYSRMRSAFKYQSWSDGQLYLRFQLGPTLPHHVRSSLQCDNLDAADHHTGRIVQGDDEYGWGEFQVGRQPSI